MKREITSGDDKPVPKLAFTHGQVFTYRLVAIPGKEGLFLDLGFRLRQSYKGRLKEGECAALGKDAERVQFVFVTVDPERDTPTRMQDYLAHFDKDFIGLTGTPDELAPVYEAYSVYHRKVELKDSALGYLVEHSASVRVVDPRGFQRTPISFGTTPDDVVANIRQVLKESTS